MNPVCVVLAAGAARRFGGPKLLARIDGKRLIDRVLDACDGRAVVVVASPAIADALNPSPSLTIIINDEPDRGMNRSLQLALEKIPVAASFMVLLADMPYVDAALVARVVTAGANGEFDIVYPEIHGVPAHPVFFGPGARPLIEALPAGDALREVREAAALSRKAFVIDEPSAARDVDTREALHALGGTFAPTR